MIQKSVMIPPSVVVSHSIQQQFELAFQYGMQPNVQEFVTENILLIKKITNEKLSYFSPQLCPHIQCFFLFCPVFLIHVFPLRYVVEVHIICEVGVLMLVF